MECNGIITAMVTPMQENQEIDLVATKQLINRLIDKGVHGLFILGTNGEAHVLNHAEKIEFAKFVITEVAGRVPVYVGVGENSTKESVKLAKEMESLGADALSVITPYFEPPTQSELIVHYESIANAVTIPIIIYNMPKKTGVNVDPKTIEKLSKISNIQGVKDSSGNIENMTAYIELTKGHEFSVLSGSDSLILEVLQRGGTGGVSSISNFLTTIMLDIYHYWQIGELELAKQKQLEIEDFRAILKLGTIPSVLKASLSLANIEVGPARLPVQVPNEEKMKKIRQVVESYRQ
ncbi:MAG: 4-hydroxy-tetrahydrodipicolinate synthase [Turicibacter sp.]|nr:4-hydroxy-tetrahydrodipicolinate synthase [Turicibacter sp.]